MKSRSRILVYAMVTVQCASAWCATQGTESSTSSTGSFGVTVNGPALPRTVQILNISDITFNNSSQSELNAGYPGATMAFCVVDSQSGSLRITSTSTNGPFGNGWAVKTASDDKLTYRMTITSADNATIYADNAGGVTSFNATLPAGTGVASSAACGAGNVKAHLRTIDISGLPATYPARTYTDTVTMVLYPQ